jgi:hypothetical protein
MNLFKTRTGILPVFLLVASFGAAAVLKPWWDRIRRLASKDSVPLPAPAATTPTSWPASHASTWTVGPQSPVPEIKRMEIKGTAGRKLSRSARPQPLAAWRPRSHGPSLVRWSPATPGAWLKQR